MMGFLYLFLAIMATSFGMVFYKLYVKKSKQLLYIALTVLCFLLTPAFSFLALQSLTIDNVYMATSLNGLIVLSLSKFILNEHVNRRQYISSGMVVVGVCLYMVTF